MSDDKDHENDHDDGEVVENPDPHFEPLVSLPPVETKTLEEDEEELLKLRAKMYRFDSAAEPAEWKERGTGEIKILHHKSLGTCRILMRRDKTLKICANHHILPDITLKPNCGSDKAWVWTTPADFADEEAKPELLATRFSNAESAQLFKEKFEDAQKIMAATLQKTKDVTSPEKKDDKCDKKTDDLPELQKLSLQEENNKSPAKADASNTSDVSSPTKTEQNSVSPKPVEVK